MIQNGPVFLPQEQLFSGGRARTGPLVHRERPLRRSRGRAACRRSKPCRCHWLDVRGGTARHGLTAV